MGSAGELRRLLDELAHTGLSPQQAGLVAALREQLTAPEAVEEPLNLLAHELKNFFALLESEEAAGPPSAATWAALQHSGADYAALLRLMLAPGRHDWTAIAGERSATQLSDLLEELLEANAARARHAGIDLGYQLAPSLAAVYGLPREALRLVLQNLLHNAMAHADDTELVVRLTGAPEGLSVELADDATPLPPAEIERLLHPAGTPPRQGARGLGLFIIHRLLASWGSELHIEATDKGNRFRFWMPAEASDETASQARSSSLGLLWMAGTRSMAARSRYDRLSHCAEAVEFPNLVALERAWLLAEPPLPRLVLDAAAEGVHPEGIAQLLTATAAGQPPDILVLVAAGTADSYSPAVNVLEKPVSPRRLVQALSGEAPPSSRAAASLPSSTPPPEEVPLQVLLVEDNELARELAQRQLGRFGAEVTAVGDGVAALRALKRARFDWLFLDWQLLLMSAEEVLAGLAQLPVRPAVALLTAEPGQIPAGLAKRVRRVLGKPLKRQDLEALFQRKPGYQSANPAPARAAEPAPAYGTRAPRLMASGGADPMARRRFLLQAQPLWEELRRAAEAEKRREAKRLATRLQRLAEACGAEALARALADELGHEQPLTVAERNGLAALLQQSLDTLRAGE